MYRIILFSAIALVFGYASNPISVLPSSTTELVSPPTTETTIKSIGNELKFAQTAFTVKTGDEIHLVFVNTATAEGMSHNVVILDTEDALNRVGIAAVGAADKDYIPEDDGILFHTPLAGPGKTVEVTFIAPKPGTYYYTCTFPGHFALMRGVMTVK
jgi:azurin